MVKNCDLGHSFSPYGPPSRQITYIYYYCSHHSKMVANRDNLVRIALKRGIEGHRWRLREKR